MTKGYTCNGHTLCLTHIFSHLELTNPPTPPCEVVTDISPITQACREVVCDIGVPPPSFGASLCFTEALQCWEMGFTTDQLSKLGC